MDNTCHQGCGAPRRKLRSPAQLCCLCVMAAKGSEGARKSGEHKKDAVRKSGRYGPKVRDRAGESRRWL